MAKKKKEKESVQVDTGVLSLAEKLKRINAVTDSINNKEKRTIVGLLSDPEIQKMLDIEYIPTASPEYNEYVGGGFPRGKITIVSGREDSGKTSFVLNTIGERMQEDPEFCALWLESEESLVDTSYLFDTFGIDPARFVFVRMEKSYGAEDALNKILDYLSSNSFDIAVINTLRALIPISEIRKKMEELDVAQQARMNSRFCGKVIPLLGESKTALIIVQQRSTSIGSYSPYGDMTELAGGLRIRYQAMLITDFKRGRIDKQTDPISPEEGIKVIVRVDKNHCIPNRYPYVKFSYFAVYGEGIEKILSTLDLAVEQGILRRAGAHIYWEEDGQDEPRYHWTSKNDFRTFMRNNPDVLKELMSLVHHQGEQISEEELKEIQKEEEQALQIAKELKLVEMEEQFDKAMEEEVSSESAEKG